MSGLYLHEAYLQIESLAIRLEMVERTRRYLPYSKGVYSPFIKQGSDDVLEEALACAEMYRRFKTESSTAGVHDLCRTRLSRCFQSGSKPFPPSYKEAWRYLKDRLFDGAQHN